MAETPAEALATTAASRLRPAEASPTLPERAPPDRAGDESQIPSPSETPPIPLTGRVANSRNRVDEGGDYWTAIAGDSPFDGVFGGARPPAANLGRDGSVSEPSSESAPRPQDDGDGCREHSPVAGVLTGRPIDWTARPTTTWITEAPDQAGTAADTARGPTAAETWIARGTRGGWNGQPAATGRTPIVSRGSYGRGRGAKFAATRFCRQPP